MHAATCDRVVLVLYEQKWVTTMKFGEWLAKWPLAALLFIVFFRFDSQINWTFVKFSFQSFPTLLLSFLGTNESVENLWNQNLTNILWICESNQKKTINKNWSKRPVGQSLAKFRSHPFLLVQKNKVNGEFP